MKVTKTISSSHHHAGQHDINVVVVVNKEKKKKMKRTNLVVSVSSFVIVAALLLFIAPSAILNNFIPVVEATFHTTATTTRVDHNKNDNGVDYQQQQYHELEQYDSRRGHDDYSISSNNPHQDHHAQNVPPKEQDERSGHYVRTSSSSSSSNAVGEGGGEIMFSTSSSIVTPASCLGKGAGCWYDSDCCSTWCSYGDYGVDWYCHCYDLYETCENNDKYCCPGMKCENNQCAKTLRQECKGDYSNECVGGLVCTQDNDSKYPNMKKRCLQKEGNSCRNSNDCQYGYGCYDDNVCRKKRIQEECTDSGECGDGMGCYEAWNGGKRQCLLLNGLSSSVSCRSQYDCAKNSKCPESNKCFELTETRSGEFQNCACKYVPEPSGESLTTYQIYLNSGNYCEDFFTCKFITGRGCYCVPPDFVMP